MIIDVYNLNTKICNIYIKNTYNGSCFDIFCEDKDVVCCHDDNTLIIKIENFKLSQFLNIHNVSKNVDDITIFLYYESFREHYKVSTSDFDSSLSFKTKRLTITARKILSYQKESVYEK